MEQSRLHHKSLLGNSTKEKEKEGLGQSHQMNMYNSQLNRSQFNKNMQSPTRRYNKPEEMSIQNDMLGAGTDPIAKHSDFSVLAGNAAALMKTQFIKPNMQKIRYPPILDRFSRTLAAPICAQKYNLSVVNRIGNMYTHSAQRIYLDYESKAVRFSNANQ